MKITDADYAALRDSCVKVLLDNPGTVEAYRLRGLSHERLRFDVLHATGASGALYKYLDDEHIDTALRRIVPAYKPAT